MSFDLTTCKWVIWGGKRPYNTFGHIFEAFLRALKYLGKDVRWLDVGDDMSGINFSNTLFLSMNCVIDGMPRRTDCFYVVHNVLGHPAINYFAGLKLLHWGVHVNTNRYADHVVEIGPHCFFDQASRSLAFRWATDLLPHEIQANKPSRVFNSESRVCTYVGSIDYMKQPYLDGFRRACQENGLRFDTYGGHGGGRRVSVEEQVQLIKDSYLCPAIEGRDQNEQGYVSCRLFKNISAGQMGLTCCAFANEIFGGRLVCQPDAYHLFYAAKERLQSMRLEELHALMDEVAANHTYLNKIRVIEHAVAALA